MCDISSNINSHTNGPTAKVRKNANSIGLVILTSLFVFSITCFIVMYIPSQTSSVSSILPVAIAQIALQDEGQKFLQSSSSISSAVSSHTASSLSFRELTLSSLSSPSSSSSSSFSSTSLVSGSNDFRISYSKLAVVNASYLRILYDSNTNSLRLNNISTTSNNVDESGRLSLSQQLSERQSNKQISDSDSSNLRLMIENSPFFQLDTMYPASNKSAKDSYDAVYVLTIEMHDNLHNVIWTDNSDIPESLMSIAKTIESINSG